VQEIEAALQRFGEFLLSHQLVRERAAPFEVSLGAPIPVSPGFR
jgi:hypothetical protein